MDWGVFLSSFHGVAGGMVFFLLSINQSVVLTRGVKYEKMIQ